MDSWILGFLVGLITVIYVAILKKRKYPYDERQLIMRGNAFKSGFITLVILLLIGMYLYAKKSNDITLFIVEMGGLIILLTSFLVFIIYCIWIDAYFPLKTCSKRAVYIILLTLSLINILIFLITQTSHIKFFLSSIAI